MSKTKYFDRDNKGQLISATKCYINAVTYEIETTKTDDNFEVDTLIAKSISLLNQKGYHTISSNAGHVYHYFLSKHSYTKKSLQIDDNGNKYMYLGYHGGYPVKYELVSEESKDFVEYQNSHPILSLDEVDDMSVGIFRVTFPHTTLKIEFIEQYDFPNLPTDWFTKDSDIRYLEGRTEDYTRIDYIFRNIKYEWTNFNIDDFEERIIKANNDLLHWVEQLPTR